MEQQQDGETDGRPYCFPTLIKTAYFYTACTVISYFCQDIQLFSDLINTLCHEKSRLTDFFLVDD